MSWVQSLQSRLDEVQSSIDARLEKKLSEKRVGPSKLSGVEHTRESLPASAQSDITRPNVAKSETATKASVTSLMPRELAPGHPAFVEDEEEQAVAWPSLAATVSTEVALSSQNIPSPAAVVQELAEEPEPSSSGYEDVDAVIRAQLIAGSCAALLARAQAGAAELELRWADCSDSRAARATGRKTVSSKMRAWRAGDLDAKDLASAVSLELEACGRHSRELEEALARGIDACGRPVTAAHSKLGEMRMALDTAERTARAAKREEAESVERQTIGLSQVARDEHARATRVVWRLARAGLRAKASERARLVRRLEHATIARDIGASSSGGQAEAEGTMTLRAALLAFRSEAFESHRTAAGEALKATGIAVTCRERLAALANKHQIAETTTTTDGIETLKRVMTKLSAETSMMFDAMIPSDAARRRQEKLVHKLEEAEAECDRLRVVASKAEREAEVASEQLAEAGAEIERLRESPNSARNVQSAKAEAATASRRAAEASAVAKEALAQLDRERASRKSRELAALKNLNEQLRSARSEARASRESAAEVAARLESEQDAHRAAAAVNETLIAGTDGLRAQIAQLAEKMVAAAAARRDAEHRARDLDNRLSETKHDRDAVIDSLRSNLQLAIDARDQAIRDMSNHMAAVRQHQQPKYQLHRKSSLDIEANNNHQEPSSPKKHAAAAKMGGRRLFSLLRLLFVVYALALHVLAYISFHRCGYAAISNSIPDAAVNVIVRKQS